MNEIYKKINNHKILTNEDIETFVVIKTKGRVKVRFVSEPNIKMAYDYKTSSLIINKNFRKDTIKFLIGFACANFKSSNNNKSDFLIDLYNIYLINAILHELSHYEQFNTMIKAQTFKSKIIKFNEEFLHYNPVIYRKNHDLYYNEYDAVINSLIETLYIIENKCDNLNKNSVSEFNRIVASIIYHSYGNKYPIDVVTHLFDKFSCPIKYSQYLSNCWNEPRDKKILSICIKNLAKESKTEYLKLINGFELDDETMYLIYCICIKDIVTTNILNAIKEIDTKKVKTK